MHKEASASTTVVVAALASSAVCVISRCVYIHFKTSRASLHSSRGLIVLVGPAGGKSTLASKHRDVVFDPETVMQYSAPLAHVTSLRALRVLEKDDAHELLCRNHRFEFSWEALLDTPLLFFKHVLPQITAHAVLFEGISVANFVDGTNAHLVGRYMHGMCHESRTELFGHRVAVVETTERLDERICERRIFPRYLPRHGSYTWHMQCHVLLAGIARMFSLPVWTMDRLCAEASSMVGKAGLDVIQDKLDRRYQHVWFSVVLESTIKEPQRHLLVEVFPGEWCEYHYLPDDGSFKLIALYDSDGNSESAPLLVLKCRGSTTYCHDIHHDGHHHTYPSCCVFEYHINCDNGEIVATSTSSTVLVCEVSTRNLGPGCYVPQLAAQNIKQQRNTNNTQPCVIAYLGSFAPFHKGHCEAIRIAKKTIEASQRWRVVAVHVAPLPKLYPKKYPLPFLSSWDARARIARHVLDADKVLCDISVLDNFSSRFFEFPLALPDRLHEHHLPVFWLNGSDITPQIEKVIYIQPRNKLKHVIVPRGTDGDHEQRILELWRSSARDLCDHENENDDLLLISDDVQTLELSSTVVREKFCDGHIDQVSECLGSDCAAAWMCFLAHQYEKELLHNMK
eukprot:PhM_4_TR13214/c0_g1_i1/m.2421